MIEILKFCIFKNWRERKREREREGKRERKMKKEEEKEKKVIVNKEINRDG